MSLVERLQVLASAVESCELELPIDARETCNAAAIAIEMAKKDNEQLKAELAEARKLADVAAWTPSGTNNSKFAP